MLLLALLLAIDPPKAVAVDPPIHSGRAGHTAVKPPRLDGKVLIDGVLDEPQWQQAALLTGFSQYSPVDGVPAADSTEVLIWYSATALYIGIRAFDSSGAVHATLATRDRIFADDNVQMYLSTFNDGRQATFFAVNPLGVQADGALNESGGLACGMTGCGASTRQPPSLAQDFNWDSKGRITPYGYEVEIRIPFKSIRFQAGKTQTWGVNFVRVVKRTGQEQTWTMAKLASSSFLAQSGRLEGLADLDAGHVLDIVPTATSRLTGTAPAPGESFDFNGGTPQLGADLRYGITPNLTLRATAHPDFSQIESDVIKFAFDPRQAVRYPEKRPFFLDGVEQFDAPFGLIYTRRLVQPVFASKLTGKVGNNQVGVLAAVDDKIGSSFGDNPAYGIVRASHDLGPGSRIGALWTEQHDGDAVNRVLDVDGRYVINKVNSVSWAAGMAHDDRNGVVNDAVIWNAAFRRSGRNFRAAYSISGIPSNFITRTGLITQRDIVTPSIDHSYTWLFSKKAVEAFTADLQFLGNWKYDDFVHGGSVLNKYLHANFNTRLKGGWNVGASYFREQFGYDSTIFRGYYVKQLDGSYTPFTGGGTALPNNDFLVSFSTPTWKHFDMSVSELAGLNDENFNEWSPARLFSTTVAMNVRPSDQLRFNLSVTDNHYLRASDGSQVQLQHSSAGTVEYQLSRAFQLRVISQYSIDSRDSLRDDTRTNLALVQKVGANYTPLGRYDNRSLQTSFLFTYLPTPGTVVYLGYGNVSQQPDPLGRPRIGSVQSDFFLKLSYLWRMRG